MKGKLLKELIKGASKKGKQPNYGKMKSDLSIKKREGSASKEELGALKELREADKSATRSQRIKQSQSSRKKEVTLSDVSGMEAKQKGSKIEFVDEKTGEVFEMSKKQYDDMTPRQRIQYLNNLKKRTSLAEDLSDKGMAKQRKKLAASKGARKRKQGGKLRGMGVALRGGGKVSRT
jgi:hypothetical protein